MMSAVAGNGLLDVLGSSLTGLISGGLERLFGPDVRAQAVGTVSWADLGAVLCLVLLVLLMNGLAAWFLRSTIRRAESRPSDEGWREQLFRASGKPAHLLIWLCGIYLAASPLVLNASSEGGVNPARQLLDTLFDLGLFALVFWVFIRLTRVLATAADSGKAWDLRCEIREKLILFIQKNFPQHLPRVRAEVGGLLAEAGRLKSPVSGPA